MARLVIGNGNTDSGFEESDPECETRPIGDSCSQTVLLIVDIGSSIMTSRDDNSINNSLEITQIIDQSMQIIESHDSPDLPIRIRSGDELTNHCNDHNNSDQSVAESTQLLTETNINESNGLEVALISDHEMIIEERAESDVGSFQLVRSDTSEVLTISLDTFSEYESQCLSEFFNNTQKGKSCDSYIQIRNHFIRHWISIKPKRFGYHDLLRKIGYLHLGNVTAFSRVQKFLEANKVINLNAMSKQEFARSQRRLSGVLGESRAKRVSIKPKRSYSDNQMKKLGLNSSGNGGVITETEGVANGGGVGVAKVQSRTRPNNPFKLVPLESYESETQAPFQLRLSMEALAIVDIHAHCVKTEVIGLLGGLYDNKTQQLFILTAEPCASLDDHDLQCDMDPVSQADAKESLEKRCYSVVGWYHSHPTFRPNPSVRDLETQSQYQTLFSKESSQPFVALILSPYLNSSQSEGSNQLVSKFKCLWVSDQSNAQNDYKIPFELCPQIIRREKLLFSVTNKLKELCAKIKTHASKIQMQQKIKRFRLPGGHEINYLDKLCESLNHYLLETGLSSVECNHMLDECKQILIRLDDTTTTTTATTTTTTPDITPKHDTQTQTQTKTRLINMNIDIMEVKPQSPQTPPLHEQRMEICQ